MGSYKRPRAFGPLDLEIIEQVYQAAWAQIEARDMFRDTSIDGQRKKALRKSLFALAGSGPVDFDALCEKVMAGLPEPRAKTAGKKPRRSTPQVGA